jgi:transposase
MLIPNNCIKALYPFKSYRVEKINASPEMVQIDLAWDRRFALRCPDCGQAMGENRSEWQMVRDLPWGSASVVLLRFEAFQGRCAQCGRYHTIRPAGIDERRRATQRLLLFASRLCRETTLSAVADLLGVAVSTVLRWDKAVLTRQLPPPQLDGLRVLLIDEKAVGKHHHYVTLVMNGETGELLYMAEGKKKESLERFFQQLTPEQKRSIEAVGIDRAGAYYAVVRDYLPKAAIVYDKFHLIANYNGVIDEVRRAEWHRAKTEQREVIKGERYNLFRNRENQTPEQKRDLAALLALNENLHATYVLKDALKCLWTYRYPKAASNFLDRWVGWAKEAALRPLERFANSLLQAREEIISFCKHPITNGRLEGFNNLISRLIHRACGVRDLDYLFLKLRQESLPDLLPK